jgi:hypothetical protein
MAQVTCIVLDSSVTLDTEKGQRLSFNKGDTLMIMFSDEDASTNYLVCSAGGGLPFVWVARNHNHKVIEMELSEWVKYSKSKKWKRFVLPMIG